MKHERETRLKRVKRLKARNKPKYSRANHSGIDLNLRRMEAPGCGP
jgi:hypothetical protein